MRILFLSENFPPETNAAATRVYERACYWVRWGHQVTVITQAPNFPQGRLFPGYRNAWRRIETMDGIRVVRMKTFIAPNRGTLRRTLDFLSFMVTGVAGGLGERRPDVVVATSPQFFAAVAGWALAVMRRIPFIFELGDLWPASIVAVGAMRPSLALRLLERVELFLYRRAAAVVALTRAFKDNLVQRSIAADKIAVVLNGVDLPRYAPRPRDTELQAAWGLRDKFVLGYVGTLGMAHGLGNVLDAAERLRDDTAIRFLLVGPGAERDMLEAEAKRRGLGNVVFAPPQEKAMMPRVWSLCDVALVHLKPSPAFAEVIPSKIFEAMAMGLPLLLAAPQGEASTLIEAERVGLCVPAGDPAALAEAARLLASNDRLRLALATASLAAAPRHSRETQARDMERVLERVLAGDGAHAAAAVQP
ncbi:MAG: glycosyltransferase family 4 protein [Proteobacteria bacterium]|nr:glycosyltransferase family 4 protein [Pseudomonadota bacterium]